LEGEKSVKFLRDFAKNVEDKAEKRDELQLKMMRLD
jgi:hypothetical protein